MGKMDNGRDLVSCGIEPLSYMLMTGLPELAYQAWMEIGKEYINEPYSPDWESYQRRELKNDLRFIAMRMGKILIGYAVIIIDTDIHCAGLLVAQYRDIYVTKDKRGYAAKLVRFVDKSLISLSVKRVLIGQRLTSSGDFYEAMGFEPQEIVHGKNLSYGVGSC